MEQDVEAGAILRTSATSVCKCRNLRIRSRLFDGRPAVNGKLAWDVLHLPLRWTKKIHTFVRAKCVLHPTACDLCRLVAASFESSGDSHVDVSIYYVYSGRDVDGKSIYTVVLCVGAKQLLPLGLDAHLLGRTSSGCARLPDPSCLDLQHVRGWLSKCEQAHRMCKSEDQRRARDVVEQPKRLINVRTMCVEQSNTSHRRYLALSYVWGRAERKLLSTDDPQKMSKPGFLLQEISGGRIHSIVGDAIRMTRDLDETYLWVDSLCICQNNLLEKRQEISRMNDIFKGAFMTIVALDCHSADDGLPGISTSESPRTVPVVTIDGVRLLVATEVYPFLNPAADRALGYVDAGIRNFGLPVPEDRGYAKSSEASILRDAPYDWHQRAWTMQEALFSRRKLYLTAQQAYFSCNSETWSEFQVEVPSTYSTDLKGFNNASSRENSEKPPWGARLTEKLNPQWVSPLMDRWWESWKEMVEHYSSRSSHLSEDRYFAFQGIMQEQRKTMGVRCLDASPVRLLPVALGWNHTLFDETNATTPTTVITRRSDRIRAYPSWSWIGWTGPVTFPSWHGSYRPCIREITVLGNTASETFKYQRSGRVEEQRPLHKTNAPIVPLTIRTKHAQAGNDSLLGTTVTDPNQGTSFLLVFEARCVTMSDLIYTADGNSLVVKSHGHWAGVITLPHPISTLTAFKVSSIVLLVGTSRRKLCFLYRNAYRPAKLLDARDKRKYHARKHLPRLALALPILAGDGIFLYWYISYWTAKDLAFQAGQVVLLPLIFLLISVGPFVALLIVCKGMVSILGIDRVVHVILVEHVGNGVYERQGAGEMSLRVFNNAKPQRKKLKLR